jgi:hypothetical protein
MKYEPGLQWLSGLRVINHHTLSDFRSRNGAALRELFEQVLALLHMQRLITLERVTQAGTKIRAHVNKKTSSRESTIRAHLKVAREQLEYLGRQAGEEQSTQRSKSTGVGPASRCGCRPSSSSTTRCKPSRPNRFIASDHNWPSFPISGSKRNSSFAGSRAEAAYGLKPKRFSTP